VARDAAASDAVARKVVKMPAIDGLRLSELNRTTWPEVRDQIVNFTHDAKFGEPRSYPGYPCWPLPRCRPRPWPSLEKVLWSRRSASRLTTSLPPRATLSRLLQFSHGVSAQGGRGPTPSAGSLQALELYLVNFTAGWLPVGTYHYQRGDHSLAQLAEGAKREAWRDIVPSLELMEGGVLLWIIVGDSARVRQKYGSRGARFLLLEAGHLMQNLGLMSERVGWTTVPLGAFFEQEIARFMGLPADDSVLYLGALGKGL
jgi:SagB-type dehydrogenase family enzyme